MITIDEFRENDLGELIRIYNDATRTLNWDEFTEEQKAVVLYERSEDRDEFSTYLEDTITLVARENAMIVGFVSMMKRESEDLPEGFIPFFYVDPRSVGRGVGRRLHETLEERARERSITTLSCHSSAYAKPIYEKLGFEDRGVDPWSVERDTGEIVVFNDHLMVKKL
jgi:GNAT superfamily N-acetyltransferase